MKKLCVICGKEINGNYITYMPVNDKLCSNDCLINYRINRDENTKTN